jgi:DNA helicase II / ATP-dependent DNA helicase PcrA
MAKFAPSVQQAAFFSWIKTGTGSCVLEAVAGAGKTTTLVEALKLMEGSIFFGAYNKKIAEEIAARAPKRDGLYVSTMHAAGFKAWRRVAPKVQVDSNKCRTLFRDAVSRHPEYAPFEGPVLDLVSYAKQAAVGVTSSVSDRSVWLNLIDHFDIETADNDEMVIKLAKALLNKSVANDHLVIDFDDMIYAPLIHKVKAYEHDWVLIDEAQDTNAARRALALLMLKRGGRLVAVGDRHQAIYGFTGADADALDLIAKAVSAVQMPLTVTYRCPKSVVAHAKTYVSHIEAHETAPDGVVRTLGDTEKLIDVAKPGDAILCRFNAPVIQAAYSFIAAGIPAKVEGREIGAGLKALARRWKSKSFAQLLDNLDKYREREVAKFRAKEQESRAAAIEDKVECLKVLVARVEKIDPKPNNVVDRICTEIDSIFGDNVGKECVLLSTIHKSKGREWKRVFWLQTGPSKWARKDWELEQEKNLCYVATTRAISELILCQAETK